MEKNPTAYWIHCNKCFRIKEHDESVPFFYTQCSHVFCTSCLGPTCFVCRKVTNAVKIDAAMPPSMKIMFQDLREILKRIPDIVKFQWGHQSHALQSKQENAVHLKDTYRKQQRMHKADSLLQEDLKREHYKVMKMEEYIAEANEYRQHNLHEGQHSSKGSSSQLRNAMYNRSRMRHQEEKRLQVPQNQRQLEQQQQSQQPQHQQYEESFQSEQRSTPSRPRTPPSGGNNSTRDTGFSSRATSSFFKFT